MPYPSTPYKRATPETALRPSSTILGHSMPYTYAHAYKPTMCQAKSLAEMNEMTLISPTFFFPVPTGMGVWQGVAIEYC
jgi:hypothetical protein